MVSQLPAPHSGPMSTPKPETREEGHDRTNSPAAAPEHAIEGVYSSADQVPLIGRLGSDGRDLLSHVRRGLPFDALDNLIHAIGVPQKEIASVIGIPQTTLARRRKTGRLTPVESDHVVRVARLVAMARNLMADDQEVARRWLTTPHRLLGDETPLRRASTEIGGREVEQLIGQLRHGVFS